MEPGSARHEENLRPARLELAPRRPRLAGAPALLILLVWALLWVWMALGVLAPLSRPPGGVRPAAAALRA